MSTDPIIPMTVGIDALAQRPFLFEANMGNRGICAIGIWAWDIVERRPIARIADAICWARRIDPAEREVRRGGPIGEGEGARAGDDQLDIFRQLIGENDGAGIQALALIGDLQLISHNGARQSKRRGIAQRGRRNRHLLDGARLGRTGLRGANPDRDSGHHAACGAHREIRRR